MDNTWYYTLSTIAQTLAAVFGLAAVFITLGLESLNKKLVEYKKVAHRIIQIQEKHIGDFEASKIINRTASGVYKDLREIVNKYEYDDKYHKNSGMISDIAELAKFYEPNLKQDNLSFLKNIEDNLRECISKRNDLLESIKLPGIVTFSTIIYVIFLLSMSNIFYCNNILVKLLFFLATLFTVTSILLVVTTSWKLIKDVVHKV